MALARLSLPAARAKRLIGSAGGSIDRPQCIEHYRISVIGQVRLPVKRRHMHFGEHSSILESILTSVLDRMGRTVGSPALRHFPPTVSYGATGGPTYTPPISLWERNPTAEPGIAIRGALSILVTFCK